MNSCYKCGEKNIKLYSTFGKYICKDCLDKRKTNHKGHSGMIYDKDIKEDDYYDSTITEKYIALKLIPKSHKLYVKWFIEHYPESKGVVGRTINYLVYSYGKPIGIIGFASPPLNYKKFNDFFKLDINIKASENAKLFLNNNVFRIVHTQRNIGTQILKLARNQIFKDYKQKYNEELLGLITFVEPPRTGAMYKADNWIYIGETEGIEVKRRGEEWTDKKFVKGAKKYIYGYKYKTNYKE